MTSLPTILIIDDEVRSQESLRRTLDEDFRVYVASSADEARIVMEQETIQIILTDQRMPGCSGVKFLTEVRQAWPDTIRIIISGYTDSEDIIAGINEAGIYQYLLKPWHPAQLLLTLKNAASLYALQQENRRISLDLRVAEPVLRQQVEIVRERVKTVFGFNNIVRAADSPLQQLCEILQRAARFDVSILISGESGTGKELLARAIHYASPRCDKPFVVENCGALQDTLLDSELFGHRKGSYTGASEHRIGLFQRAHGGTLFLDEIGETSPAFQVKLLRVLQEGEIRPLGSNQIIPVDVRVIAATNKQLEKEIAEGRFREDLYYRLSTVPVQVPPLRERRMDIPILAQHILKRAGDAFGRKEIGFAPGLVDRLAEYDWIGNVRELQNEIQRMLVLSDAETLTSGMLAPHIRRVKPMPDAKPAENLRGRVGELEIRWIQETLARHRHNLSRAAHELGMSRPGLRNKMLRLGIAQVERRKGRPGSVGEGC
ncbi:MAG: sigma-54-dependent transcriptional regulator [Burkholderiales bacterium]